MYSSDEESIDNITMAAASKVVYHQVYAIINPHMGVELSEGDRTPRVNRDGRRNAEASGSNEHSAYTITGEEWEVARNAIANNTRIPVGASVGTLSTYHVILQKNRVQLANEQADLNRHRQAADQLSERRRGLPSHGSVFRSNQGQERFWPRIPRLSEADAREITSNLSNSFMTMDTAGMVRPKNYRRGNN
jgi:hypothetical protein